jgi:hypothetical protein
MEKIFEELFNKIRESNLIAESYWTRAHLKSTVFHTMLQEISRQHNMKLRNKKKFLLKFIDHYLDKKIVKREFIYILEYISDLECISDKSWLGKEIWERIRKMEEILSCQISSPYDPQVLLLIEIGVVSNLILTKRGEII